MICDRSGDTSTDDADHDSNKSKHNNHKDRQYGDTMPVRNRDFNNQSGGKGRYGKYPNNNKSNNNSM